MTLTQQEYAEKVQRRYDRYIAAAQKAQQESEAARKRSDEISDQIPMGQPILIGHHSEKRHRAALEKIHNGMRKGWELHKKAEEYRSRAASIENNDAIYSDNPDAVSLLTDQLNKLTELQAAYKATNEAWRKFKKDPASLDDANIPDSTKNLIRNFKPEWSGDQPIPAYRMTNNNANIKRLQKRIEEVSKKQSLEDTTEQIGDISIEYAPGENRIRIHYPARVSPEIFKALRSHGFRVLRSAGEGWFSAFHNNNALYFIKAYIKK